MALNDVTAAFDGWLTTISGERTTGSYVSGRWVAGVPTPLSFKGVLQNATPNDLKVLPEGNRGDEAIKIHTKFKLIAQEGSTTGDMISYDGKNWMVYNLANREIGGYYKALCIKQD